MDEDGTEVYVLPRDFATLKCLTETGTAIQCRCPHLCFEGPRQTIRNRGKHRASKPWYPDTGENHACSGAVFVDPRRMEERNRKAHPPRSFANREVPWS
jgi:hypothetical protein